MTQKKSNQRVKPFSTIREELFNEGVVEPNEGNLTLIIPADQVKDLRHAFKSENGDCEPTDGDLREYVLGLIAVDAYRKSKLSNRFR